VKDGNGEPPPDALQLSLDGALPDPSPVRLPDLSSYTPSDDYPEGHVGPPPGQTIEEAFYVFHAANPQVYAELVRLARQARRRGVQYVGINMLLEVTRWNFSLRTSGDEFKLNNNWAPYYSRLIMLQEPDLEGIFHTRRLRAPEARQLHAVEP
jgi:hypothetical protein